MRLNLSANCTLERGRIRFSGQSSSRILQDLWSESKNVSWFRDDIQNTLKSRYFLFCTHEPGTTKLWQLLLSEIKQVSLFLCSRKGCKMWTACSCFEYCEKTLPLNSCVLSVMSWWVGFFDSRSPLQLLPCYLSLCKIRSDLLMALSIQVSCINAYAFADC